MSEQQTPLQPGSGQALLRVIEEMRNALIYMKNCGFTGFDASPETMEKIASLGQSFRRKQAPVRPGAQGSGRGTSPPGKRPQPPSRFQAPPAPSALQNPPPQAQHPRQPVQQTPVTPVAKRQQPKPPILPKGKLLEMIRTELVGDCRRCRLCLERRTIVFGEGSPDARLMFVGDGPRADEDMEGRFYAGEAGELLLKIIKAIELTPKDVYIASVVKCRLPDRQLPGAEEIRMCLPFLQRQINTVQPEFICALGKTAAQTLLNTDAPITALRGKSYNFQGITVIPTFHPAYLVKQPKRKREAWGDLQMLMQKMKPR